MPEPEYLDVVNENDRVIGKATKEEVYQQGLMHRIVHVFVVNKDNKIYIQQRGPDVKYLPNHFITSAGGHVRSGETYIQAANRELKEELGLRRVTLVPAMRTKFYIDEHGRHIVLYIAFANAIHKREGGKVAPGHFLRINTVKTLVDNAQMIHPQLPVCFSWLYKNKERLGYFRKRAKILRVAISRGRKVN